ncbi:MAG: hypothetical protein AAGG80_01140, partial [Pseudomonadota bacterium]
MMVSNTAYQNQLLQMDVNEFAYFLMNEIEKEKLLILDFRYISAEIEAWWSSENKELPVFMLKAKINYIFMKKLNREHLGFFDKVGLAKNYIAGICVRNIFTTDSPKLALVVHESLSELFHLSDIQYEYEEHKTLFLKKQAVEYKDWGSGYGEITPHSDDLYEGLNVDYLSLTTCRDETSTPTRCFFPKHILRDFTKEELFRLYFLKANFKSGKNVKKHIQRQRNILSYCTKYGFRFFLDFRID